MARKELIARLYPKPQHWDVAVGGESVLDAEGTALLFSGLPQHEIDIAMAIWAGDDRALDKSRAYLTVRAPEKLRSICRSRPKLLRMIFSELSGIKCSFCQGHGERMVNETLRDCEYCNASGRMWMTARKCARYVGLSESEWRLTCAEDYQVIRDHIAAALSHVHHNFNLRLGDYERLVGDVL